MTKLRWFILLPGLAMWLGWGIRGQIGHSTGAMIAGALAVQAAGGRWVYTLETYGGRLIIEASFTIAAFVLAWMSKRTLSLDGSIGK